MQLTHIRLLVTAFDDCLRFYRDVLGMEVLWGEEGGRYADLKAGEDCLLALYDRQQLAQAVGRGDAPSDVCTQDRAMLIFGVDDVDSAAERVRAAGSEPIFGPVDRPEWGIRVLHLRDPDGTLIELNTPLPEEDWTEFLREANERYT